MIFSSIVKNQENIFCQIKQQAILFNKVILFKKDKKLNKKETDEIF